jgi:prenyltransferase beta subunit
MKDKPSKGPDIYHTCYSLSGLAISQGKENFKGLFANDHTIDHESFTGAPSKKNFDFEDETQEISTTEEDPNHSVLISGVMNNSIVRINPIYNARFDKVHKAREYFRQVKQ